MHWSLRSHNYDSNSYPTWNLITLRFCAIMKSISLEELRSIPLFYFLFKSKLRTIFPFNSSTQNKYQLALVGLNSGYKFLRLYEEMDLMFSTRYGVGSQ